MTDGAADMAGTTADDGVDDTAPASVSIDIRRGMPTDEELAAVVAVVTDAYATEIAGATADDGPAKSAWQATRRRLRTPLRRGASWGRFSG